MERNRSSFNNRSDSKSFGRKNYGGGSFSKPDGNKSFKRTHPNNQYQTKLQSKFKSK